MNAHDLEVPPPREDWPAGLPPPYALALDAGTGLEDLPGTVGNGRDYHAWLFFCCGALHGAAEMMLGESAYEELAPMLARHSMLRVPARMANPEASNDR